MIMHNLSMKPWEICLSAKCLLFLLLSHSHCSKEIDTIVSELNISIYTEIFSFVNKGFNYSSFELDLMNSVYAYIYTEIQVPTTIYVIKDLENETQFLQFRHLISFKLNSPLITLWSQPTTCVIMWSKQSTLYPLSSLRLFSSNANVIRPFLHELHANKRNATSKVSCGIYMRIDNLLYQDSVTKKGTLEEMLQRLRESKSLVLSNYPGKANFSRHHMVLKLLIETFNLTVTSSFTFPECASSFVYLQLVFTPNVIYQLRNTKATELLLISNTHNTFVETNVRYLIAYENTYNLGKVLLTLINPIGWKILVVTLGCLSANVMFVWIVSSRQDTCRKCKSISFELVSSYFMRPLIGQNTELGYLICEHRNYLRVALSSWLLCCLTIPELYKGELISCTTKPTGKVWKRSFDDLMNGTSLKWIKINEFSTFESEGSPAFKDVLAGNPTVEGRRLYNRSLERWAKRSDIPGTQKEYRKTIDIMIAQGKFILFGPENGLRILERKLDITWRAKYFKLSDILFKVPQHYSICCSPKGREMIHFLNKLRPGGLQLWYAKDSQLVRATYEQSRIFEVFDRRKPPHVLYDMKPADVPANLLNFEAVGYLYFFGVFCGLIGIGVEWLVKRSHSKVSLVAHESNICMVINKNPLEYE